MSSPRSSDIPTALVTAIIQTYADGIRPAFSFILIAAIFSAMLIPLLIMLFALSTPKTRRTPIFALNVLAVVLGIIVGALSNHLTIQSVLSPFSGVNPTEDFVYNILYVWMPWISEAVLLVRVIVVFRPTYQRMSNMVLLLGFPVVIKTARAVINIMFLVQWKRNTSSSGAVNQFNTTQSLDTWMPKVDWILELFDNAYISFLFLWRLGTQAHLFDAATIGRVEAADSRGSLTSKLKTLFWIASTNFVFPLIFGLCQVILLFSGKNILIAASVEMVNVYVAIISTVFATIWSSTSSFKEANSAQSSNSSVDGPKSYNLEPIIFRRGQTTTTSNPMDSGSQEGGPKTENWEGKQVASV
ncbi:hypothetical protein C8J56DRAFT_827326 [Mycena floridula]|nr:hypothetical protein C8J56DRAFT_827326 [Mycena floridula]